MAQNRKPPAYQEYAATMLADRNYKLMTLEERGLLYSMRLECWHNRDLPSSLNDLAKYLGIEFEELNKAFSDRVKSFFKENNRSLNCPELEDYRQHLVDIRLKQSKGGKQGAAIVNEKNKRIQAQLSNTSAGNPQAPQRVSRSSLVQLNEVKQSQDQSLDSGINQDKWIDDYDRASNG